mmetsp:Transcript_18438/g.53166  ORF Transcript_18438/g.53166 Transcript_18438/m.53166 type:complete len:88 (-) Transcript_18438:893-1156(-)
MYRPPSEGLFELTKAAARPRRRKKNAPAAAAAGFWGKAVAAAGGLRDVAGTLRSERPCRRVARKKSGRKRKNGIYYASSNERPYTLP